MPTIPYPSAENAYLANHIRHLITSYANLLRRPLIEKSFDGENLAKKLFFADFVLLSHDTSTPPIFNYGNLAGLSLFEMTWSEFTAMPSKYSAEPDERDDREALLNAVSTKGYIDNYRGVRISKTGRRFLIENATVWNLSDDNDRHIGQAACFKEWHYLDESY